MTPAIYPAPPEIRYSVLVSASGVSPDGYAYDISIDDVERACRQNGLQTDETEPNDSEYAYLVREDYGDSPRFVETDRPDREREGEALYTPARGYIVDERTRSDWWGVFDVTASGIVDEETLDTLCHDIGASATDEETLGTLGGPLSIGIVPDIVFRIESSILIDSIRVTPFCPDWPDDEPVSFETWSQLRDATIARFGY
jgi:hypothetical protein